MTAAAQQNLIAITPGGVLSDEHMAGYYFWYSIPEASIPLPRVRRAFHDNGLDDSRLPKERRPEHVMQEACGKVRRVETNGHRVETRAEQVMRDDDFLIYQITRHVQHRESRTIEHPKALRVIFDFASASLTFEPLEGSSQADVQELVDEISDHYDSAATQVPGRKLRTIVRHYVEAAGAEPCDRGGVYFMAKDNPVPAWSKLHDYHGDSVDGREFIQRVRMMLEDVHGTAPSFHMVPCVNDEGQREFLKRMFVQNCADDTKEFRDECIELVKGKDQRINRFRADLRTGIIQRRKELDIRKQKFAAILGETLDELDQDMTLADAALTKFLQEAGE